MATTLSKKIRLFVFMAIASVLLLVNGASSSEASVNGMLRPHLDSTQQQILNIWGTNYDMGYAHGYLMADKIRDLFEHYMVIKVAGGANGYNAFLSRVNSQFVLQPNLTEEINGMVDGMKASGKSLYVPTLGRNINASDIKALNLQEQFYFGCSSFGVWGNATAGGETILARNLDFYWDNEGNNANYQMVIVYEPTGKTKFTSFAWPGSVGVYSGMNQYGVTAMVNTGNLSNPYSGPFHPVVEVYRTILETTTTANFFDQPLTVIKSMYENPPEIIQIGTSYPYENGSIDPVYYIEQSHDLDVKRTPTTSGYDYILATNYFLNPSLYTTPYWEYSQRYNTINAALLGLLNGGGKVDSKEAWGILSLKNVADSIAPTLTSIVIRPNSMTFDLSFAKVVNGVFTSATKITPETYQWPELFPALKLVARNDSYSTTANKALNPTTGVLGNDTGPEDATLTAQLVGGPSHGTLTLNADGSFAYTPAANYAGSDSFTYRANDGTNSSNVGTVSITVASAPTVALSSLSLSPTSATGGTSSTGTVRLSSTTPSPVVVMLSSSNTSAARVPASVTIAANSSSATFTITTFPVSSSKSVTISARYGVVTKTAALAVVPPALSSLTLYPTSVRGGSYSTSTGTVRLTGSVPTGSTVLVTLSSSNTSAARVPASVTVAAGSSSATFTITTSRVSSNTPVTIAARYNGVTKTAALTVLHR